MSGGYLIPCYVIFALPFAVGLIAAGCTWKPAKMTVPIALTCLLLFFALTLSQRRVLMKHPIEPMRESVRLTRQIVNPSNSEIHTVVTVGFVQYTKGYDPAFHRIQSGEELSRLLRWADERGRPLFVNFAMPELARQTFPDVMKLVDDPTLFESVGDPLYGLEGQTTRHVKTLPAVAGRIRLDCKRIPGESPDEILDGMGSCAYHKKCGAGRLFVEFVCRS